MKHTVIKIGGSVLRDRSDAPAILDILASYEGPLVVVVSALKGVTDRLCEAAEAPELFAVLIPELRREYRSFAHAFCAPEAAEEAAFLQIDRLLGACQRAGGSRDGTTRILATGERLAAVCIALALLSLGRPAAVLEPGALGLIAASPSPGSEAGEADIAASRPLIRASLAGRDAAVVPGFYGVAEDGTHCLFGRGGSDYSAAVIAACLGAEGCDLIKGVAGFFTADPSLVPGARLVLHLSYSEAEALARGGANILHQGCVEPLREAGVPFRILGGPSLRGETRVGGGFSLAGAGPRAVALMRGPAGCAAITVAGGSAASKSAAIALRALEARGLDACAFVPGADNSSFRFLVEAGRGKEALMAVHDALFARPDKAEQPKGLARVGNLS